MGVPGPAPPPPPQPDEGASPSPSFTRLCVKNVPKHVDERRLREHFAAQGGQVTDAKLLRTKAGQTRKMAFVGFRSEAEARTALKYFNGTFLDTSRLVVEAALPRGAAALARPWSRHSQGSSRFEAAQQKRPKGQGEGNGQGEDGGAAKKRRRAAEDGGGADDDGGGKEGEQGQQQKQQRRVGKEEYLATMMPRSRTQFWANDDAGIKAPASKNKDDRGAAAVRGNSSGEEQEEEEEASSGLEEEGEEESDAMQEEGDGASSDDESSLPEPEPTDASSGLDFLRSKVKKGLEKEIGGGAGAGAEDEADSGSESEDDASGSSSSSSSSEEEEGAEEEEEEEEGEDGPSTEAGASAAAAAAGEDESDSADAAATSLPPPPPSSSPPSVEETGRLFIRNLPFSATEEDVLAALGAFGQLSEVHVPLDDSKRPKGFAFATFVLPEDAQRALEGLDGQAFQGRLLHVLPAKEPPRDPLADLDPSKARTYKERKEIERRQRAGDERGWNASFMRGETVVDAVADRLGLAKGQVLDREGEGMAVKLALGETFLLAENREFFRREGVDLSVLEGAASASATPAGGGKQQQQQPPARVVRSKTTILVKNLPYSTSQEDLQRLFGRFGALGRVLLPPSRSIGLVDFLEAGDARRAFKGLAYKRYQHVPLYLEWAPLNTFAAPAAAALPALLPDATANANANDQPPQAPPGVTPAAAPAPAAPTAVAEAAVEEEVEGEGSFTLFVKNLSFATTDEGLAAFFKRRTQGVRAVNIPKKTAPPSKGKPQTPSHQQQQQLLSMGYGFVEYGSPAAAKAALKAADGALLDGHKLQCKLSDKRLTVRAPKAAARGPAKRTKLVVRNLAFQATAKEIKELFGAFGKLKTVRLPKKFDGSHRGFAFVEFLTAQEATNAHAALASTHLYGRHLVLEWAEDKDDVEALREKARKDARKGAVSRLNSDGPGAGAGGKKGGKAKGGFDEGDEGF